LPSAAGCIEAGAGGAEEEKEEGASSLAVAGVAIASVVGQEGAC